MAERKIAPYGFWRSPLDLRELFERPSPPMYPCCYGGHIYWIEARPRERGRLVLVRREANGDETCLTPEGFNIRTRVHEYGGLCYVLANGFIYFSNLEDQRLYQQALEKGAEPKPLTPECNKDGSQGMYADYQISADGRLLVFVYEQAFTERENVNTIACLPLYKESVAKGQNTHRPFSLREKDRACPGPDPGMRGYNQNKGVSFIDPLTPTLSRRERGLLRHPHNERGAGDIQEPIVLVRGHDFFANPVLSADGKHLAWVQWDHPDMPWDSSEAAVMAFEWDSLLGDRPPQTAEPKVIAGGHGGSVCQLHYGPDGTLYFALDKNVAETGEAADDYWNLHAYDGKAVRRITRDSAEYGAPHWTFGDRRFVSTGAGQLIAVRTMVAGDELVWVDTDSGATTTTASEFTGFSQVALAEAGGADSAEGGEVLCIAASGTRAAGLIRLSPAGNRYRVVKQDASLLTEGDTSIAEAIRYPTRDGAHAHAFFYPPVNSAYTGPPDAAPPLMVVVHGGPTGRSDPTLALPKQYWTTRGFALLDVNHRGSVGYGRRYRQALQGQWGEIDTNDIADGVRYLIDRRRVNPEQICIRGGSAGGYAVLRALTCFSNLFAAGACYYGIGNLATLAETTHKFEAHYLDGLLGKAYEGNNADSPDSVYYRRSPIHYLDRLQSPMILFHGLEDKVVPPAVSQEMAGKLKEKGIPYEYVEYPGEGHGFRRSETKIDALERESAFYARIFSPG